MLWAVTKHELRKHAKFDDDYLTFMLKSPPDGVETDWAAIICPSRGSMGTATAWDILSRNTFSPLPRHAS